MSSAYSLQVSSIAIVDPVPKLHATERPVVAQELQARANCPAKLALSIECENPDQMDTRGPTWQLDLDRTRQGATRMALRKAAVTLPTAIPLPPERQGQP